ncbi:MFS transporter [Mucilaginibacter sp. X5P1]|uniref:MFS transporter n=1 Tax=Mucilaginibacter sp. X5P1 TaxID=2723088 RepID=UPI0016128BB9|nr:MFS transporter [Mucilaginibacter sp. X5P1]MBB6141732.1 sugar phosphate permease [Mucilaginibacter sp. X5P1]
MKKRYQVLALLSALAVITYLDRTSISVSGPRITQSLHLTETEYGWLQAAFSIAYGLFQIPMGILGDRKGVRTVLLIVVIWWSLFTFLTGLSNTFAILLIVRFLFAVGESGAFPNIAVAISKWFPVQERARAQGYIWMFSRIGAALSPLIIVPLQKVYGWHVVFFVFGFIGIGWGLIWYFWFRENPSEMPGISIEEIKEIESNRKIKKNSAPLSFRQLINNRNLWALVLMYFFYMFGAYFFLSWLPQYLKNGRGLSEKDMGLFSSLPFVLGAIGCWLGGYLSDYFVKKTNLKWGRRIVGFSGLILSGICIIAASISVNNQVTIIFLSLGLAFKDLTLPVSWTVATEIGGKNSGAISGTMHMFGQLGSTIMTIGFGYMVAKNHNWNLPVTLIGCVAIVSGFLWFLIDASKTIENTEKFEPTE